MASDTQSQSAYRVDVCICTFRRTHIVETLQSLANMPVPAGLPFRVIVADNDEIPSARAIVEQSAARTGLQITYLHAPARNISVARNACLAAAQAPLIAFIDDDELAVPHWLASLAAVMTDAVDVVLGPVQAVYAADCPDWIRRSDLHSAGPVWVEGEILTGYTSNVLFRRTAAPFTGLSFREELGRSGGEDTAFFDEAHAAGANIAFCPAAVVSEAVPADRASFRWLFQRRFRSGQTHGFLLSEKTGGRRAPIIAWALVKATACLGTALVPTGKMGHMRQHLIRAALHAGVIARLLGQSELVQYGQG